MFSHPRNLSEILNGLDAKVHSGLKNDILQVLKLPDFYLN